MNKININVMNNKYFRAIASTMVIFTLLISAVVTPSVAVALETNFDFSNTSGYLESGDGESSVWSESSSYTTCELEASRERITVGEGITLTWDTSGFTEISINGESVSGDSGSKTISDIRENTTYKLTATDGNGSSCTAEVRITCLPPVAARCEDFGYDFQIAKYEWTGSSYSQESLLSGYTVSLSGDTDAAQWTSSPLVAGVIAKAATYSGEFIGGLSGEVVKTAIGTGKHDISNIVLCGNEVVEPEYCELEIVKSADKERLAIGEEITYTIDVKSVGTIPCTGGGVRIFDYLDANLEYVSSWSSENVSEGYGSLPLYSESEHLVRFNGHELDPGEEAKVIIVGKVKAQNQCGNFEILNKGKTTARELDNFNTWIYSNIVKTTIVNECTHPQPPVCPLVAEDGRTIVDFSGLKLRTDRGIDKAYTVVVPISINPGQYDITLVSWDGYNNRVNTTQPNEQWQLEFMNVDSVVAASGIISDLEDNVREAIKVEKVNTDFSLTSAATGLRAAHPFYPETSTANSLFPICAAIDEKPVDPAPTCDLFEADPTTIVVGEAATLTWETTNATQVFINNGIGAVLVDGTYDVSPLADITYKLTAIGVNDKTVDCEVPVKVVEEKIPVCELFTATPGQLPIGGGDVVFDWRVINAKTVSIAPTIGDVLLVGSTTVNVTQSTNFVLTAIDESGHEVTCPAPVVVPDSTPFTCGDNVSFSASDTSIRRGENTTLTWSTTDVDSLTISGINATTLSGSQSTSPSDDITYTLAATQGTQTINCPISIDVDSGGGGGSKTPRCSLDISDDKITRGEEITLTWDTSNATEITLTDDRGKVLFTTDDFLSSAKKEYFDASITLKPTRDTEYTLLAERGSRDRECKVEVEMEDNIVVLQTRDQQPLVAGISLSQVPYTGFEAGPFMTIMFYVLLITWALYVTYLLVVRNKSMVPVVSENNTNAITMKRAEVVRPDVFTPSTTAQSKVSEVAPNNLPVAASVMGLETEATPVMVNPHQVNDAVVTELENRAHQQKSLLSSDAVRYFIATTAGKVERNEALDTVISEAKNTYPLEDGWVVLNEARMQSLCEVCQSDFTGTQTEGIAFAPAVVPEGTGSLAEAIVTGNIVAAYEMIGNRPMFALADAAADLDAVYRNSRGGNEKVSDLLTNETKNLSEEQVKDMIKALTGALDGTYNDEASAVKMAIMKAVKVVA